MKTIPDALNPKFHMQIGSQSRHNSLATMVVTLLAAVFSALAVTQHWSDTGSLILLVLVTCVTLVLITAPAQAGSFVAAGSANALLRGRARAVSTLLLAMSPVILLGLAFPFASQRLAAASIDGVPLTMIVLGVSAAVPWFSQMTCMPIYRMLNSGGLQNLSELSSKLYGAWRTLLLWSIPPVTLLIIPVALFTGWSVRPLLVYLVLALLHVIFVQSLVVADVAGHRRIWALAWLAYGLAVAVVPTWWFLPPILGTLSQLMFIGGGKGFFTAPHSPSLSGKMIAADMVRGLLTGAVLWSDKFLLYLSTDGDFHAQIVYLCLQPAVLAYTYYYAVQCPGLNILISRFHGAVEKEDLKLLRKRSREVSVSLTRSLFRAGAVGVLLILSITLLVKVINPQEVYTVAAIAVASWMFMMLTLLCYELDHAGDRVSALVLSALHLLAAVGIFFTVGGMTAYLPLAAIDVVLCVVAYVIYRIRWSRPEYTFFWGKAVGW